MNPAALVTVVVGTDAPLTAIIFAINDDVTVDVKAVGAEHYFYGIRVYDNIEMARASQDENGNPAAAFWPPIVNE